MKIGIIGIGCACAFAAAIRGGAGEIVLVNRTGKNRRGRCGRYPLRHAALPQAGNYGWRLRLSNGRRLVMITAGINEKSGGATNRDDPQGRLWLLDKNATIYRDIVPRITRAAPAAVVLIVTDPPDPLADIAREAAGRARVISTGTFLDSLRFRVHLARHFAVDPGHVEAQVTGDHGTQQVFVWSSARIGGVPIAALMKKRGETFKELRQNLENEVRYANITIIEGHDASRYGIGMLSARIAEMVLRDERAVIPIGSLQEEFGVTLSLPSVVGSSGGIKVLRPELSQESARACREGTSGRRSNTLKCMLSLPSSAEGGKHAKRLAAILSPSATPIVATPTLASRPPQRATPQ
jgi:L-lactate dehydrogenase